MRLGEEVMKLHKLLMVVCGMMMVAVAYLVFQGSGLKDFSGGNLIWLGLIFLCPLMHIFMMRGMHSDKSCHGEKENSEPK